ncbi:FadR/GntR family transcriptional regulator [Nocardia implantans]|uniref:FadR/GntR family transcriptional regulator n=1 Tax=Nocardia implantans TaxID=3108168 RepID=A0ABU6ANS0_9NOCA|nr:MULTISPECIES: FadR/GntR family transcriptional regulator [unclassified Nocardia]MBF6192147.1 FadR family transcriptional regulator [Nocardia beijingensis]MEA3530280.1 FadR/GntR family transcriptional regulator [Nocardia sp. CDC192]MEB3508988.1 FadR/GntR family transcriptional regulator [Nocardia sp. CDC186]
MALQPVVKRSVSADVFEQIAADVLSGELAPGATLPSERQLAEALGVSRPAVREALQRLAAAGLVSVRQGDATTVLDYRRGAGLEVLPRLLVQAGELDPAVARSILEARLHNGPKVAELAARRVGAIGAAEVRPLLESSLDALAAEQDPIAQQRHAMEFWDHVVDAADSIVFRLMFNMLRAAYEPALAALAPIMSAEVGNIEAYRELATAIAAGRPQKAATTARALLEPATTALIEVLGGPPVTHS